MEDHSLTVLTHTFPFVYLKTLQLIQKE